MEADIDINWLGMARKWVAYFDLLGFSDLVNSDSPYGAFDVYEKCLSEFKWHQNSFPDLEFVHFSDTFLIYSKDDTKGSFAEMESASRWFIQILIQKRIPLRGALACNDFYADKSRSIFLGKGLVESSRFGELFNWIGLVLCPSAVVRMEQLNLPVNEGLNYRYWDIPLKVSAQVETRSRREVACLIGASSPMNGRNLVADELQEMMERIKRPEVRVKYENTLSFLNHFGVLRPVE